MATPLQLNGVSGGIDKIGVVSMVVPFHVDALIEAITYRPALADITLPIVSRSFKQSEEGGYEVSVTYEGVEEDPNMKVFELDGSMAEESIKTHPKFESLKTKYGWDEALNTFSEYPPDSTSGGSGGLSGGNSPNATPTKSKMYGVESWLVAGAIFRLNYSTNGMPGGIWNGIGTVQNPPQIGRFGLPSLGKRNWLKLAPKVKLRGNCVEITEEFMLSGPLGWFKEIYDAAQLSDGSGGGSSGLTTGTLTSGTL